MTLTYQMCLDYLAASRAIKPRSIALAYNTRLVKSRPSDGPRPVYAVRFHWTEILRIHHDGVWEINFNGWHTPTTAKRMAWYSPALVYTENGVPTVFGPYRGNKPRERWPYYDGIRVDRDGVPIDPCPPDELERWESAAKRWRDARNERSRIRGRMYRAEKRCEAAMYGYRPWSSLKPSDAFLIRNAALRTRFVAEIGMAAILDANGYTVMHEDTIGGHPYALLFVGLPQGFAERHAVYLRMVNPSTEELVIECVAPHVQTCRDALAWRNGLDVYEPPKVLT